MLIAQCWDDGNVDDIRLTELLRRYGARASFNLNFGLHRADRYLAWKRPDGKEVWKLALGELRSVYAGFLVANHTLTHPWLTRIESDAMAGEIDAGKDALEQHFGYPVYGFAYPYGDYDDAVAEAVRAAGHRYGRTCNETAIIDPAADPFRLPSSCHHQKPDFWDRYEACARADADGRAVFYFWGHSYEFAAEADWEGFEAKLRRIAADPRAEWIALPELFPPKGS